MTDPERELVLSYAPPARRAGLAALFALDAALGDVLRATRQPLLAQMRFTWWHDALTKLDGAPPPAMPVLEGLAREALARVTGATLAGQVEGWEVLIDEDASPADMLRAHGEARGVRWFRAAHAVLGGDARDPVDAAGRGWALADLARHLSDPGLARQALAAAEEPLSRAARARWSRPARPLGALVHLARADLRVALDRPLPRGAPQRVGRLLFHRLTGR